MNKIKMVFGIAAALAIFLLAYAYEEYHRRNENVMAARASYKLEAVPLIGEFDRDDSGSLKKYLGKVLVVKGAIREIEKDQKNDYTIFLGDSLHRSSLRCSMDSAYSSALQGLAVGKTVAIKGILIGFNADATGLLGSDIAMNRCIADQ